MPATCQLLSSGVNAPGSAVFVRTIPAFSGTTGGALLLLSYQAVMSRPGGIAPPGYATPAIVGMGLTWEVVSNGDTYDTGLYGTPGASTTAYGVFRAQAPTSGAPSTNIVLTFPTYPTVYFMWTVSQVTPVEFGANGATAIRQMKRRDGPVAGASVTLPLPPLDANSLTWGWGSQLHEDTSGRPDLTMTGLDQLVYLNTGPINPPSDMRDYGQAILGARNNTQGPAAWVQTYATDITIVLLEVAFGSPTIPWLRQRQRDDAVRSGGTGRNMPTSLQRGIRSSGSNRYH